MTKEEKQLVLQDLCSRLPYGIMMNTPKGNGHLCLINLTLFGNELGINVKATSRDTFNMINCKPYLRSIINMTEKEKDEFCDIIEEEKAYLAKVRLFNWYHAHHLDYNGLINKDLAIEAPEGMYETEEYGM